VKKNFGNSNSAFHKYIKSTNLQIWNR
jgi:hypothetical protein